MSESVYTKVRKGELPGHLLYQDKVCFVILTIQPHHPGHLLVIPVEEVANWEDLDSEVWQHIAVVAQQFAKLIKKVYQPPKVGLSIVGFEIAHVHVHVFSLFEIADIDHDKARPSDPKELEKAAGMIVGAIEEQGGINL